MGKFLKRLMLNIYCLGEEVVNEAVAEESSNCQKCKQCLISISSCTQQVLCHLLIDLFACLYSQCYHHKRQAPPQTEERRHRSEARLLLIQQLQAELGLGEGK